MRGRFLILTTLAAAALALSPTATSAEERPPSAPGPGGNAYIDGGGDPTAVAVDGTESSGGAGGGGGGGEQQCHWNVVIEDDFQFGIYDVDTLETEHSQTGRWLEYFCDGIGAVSVNGYFLIPEGGLVDPAALATDALATIDIEGPAIRTNPSAEGRLYVQIPTWLWLDQTWWQPYQATASAGRVTSTVNARPVSTTWSMGDGRSVRCSGAGRAWAPGLSDDATDCRHTYRHSSAGEAGDAFQLEATVTLEVTWTSNTGAGGTLPAISRTSRLDVEVGEIQAIGTD